MERERTHADEGKGGDEHRTRVTSSLSSSNFWCAETPTYISWMLLAESWGFRRQEGHQVLVNGRLRKTTGVASTRMPTWAEVIESRRLARISVGHCLTTRMLAWVNIGSSGGREREEGSHNLADSPFPGENQGRNCRGGEKTKGGEWGKKCSVQGQVQRPGRGGLLLSHITNSCRWDL